MNQVNDYIANYIGLPQTSILAIELCLALLIPLVTQFWRQYCNASESFRNTIYNCLDGIFPNVESYLGNDEKDRITQESIKPINTAGAKFRHYLPFFCLYFFNKALTSYCKTARETNWNEDSARKLFDNTKYDDPSPGVVFRSAVKKLIAYAK